VNLCVMLLTPFINNCGIDPEETFLTMFYGTLNARRSGRLGGSFIQFNQNQFCPKDDSAAWVFVPQSCAQQQPCRLVIALHGCLQNQQSIGATFIQRSGINEWADGNNIIVLYPQTSIVPANDGSCWDWRGYTGPNYALKSAPQMTTIMAEVKTNHRRKLNPSVHPAIGSSETFLLRCYRKLRHTDQPVCGSHSSHQLAESFRCAHGTPTTRSCRS
jgi:hypothetical protein